MSFEERAKTVTVYEKKELCRIPGSTGRKWTT
jgi:hypothetical protein